VLPLTKRQREILDYLNDFIQQHGYAPSLEEIGRRFGLSSLATVHKHLTTSSRRGSSGARGTAAFGRARADAHGRPGRRAPLLGYVAAGRRSGDHDHRDHLGAGGSRRKRDTYVLRVRGDSMIDEQIRDGDYVVVEDRKTAENGEMVIALLRGSDVTLKKFYRDNGRVRLQPANPAMQPLLVDSDQIQVQGVVVGVMRKSEAAMPEPRKSTSRSSRTTSPANRASATSARSRTLPSTSR
jgi:repressor LexA